MNQPVQKKRFMGNMDGVYNFPVNSMQARSQAFPNLSARTNSCKFRIDGESNPRSHWSRAQHHGPVFSAGQPVAETGIYEVIHDGAHRAAHEVVMLSGDNFPPCDTCAGNVRFRLVRTAPYIFQDEDFEEQE